MLLEIQNIEVASLMIRKWPIINVSVNFFYYYSVCPYQKRIQDSAEDPKRSFSAKIVYCWKGSEYTSVYITAQKMKISVMDFFGKCEQIWRRLRVWSHSLKKSLMEIFIFCAVYVSWIVTLDWTWGSRTNWLKYWKNYS